MGNLSALSTALNDVHAGGIIEGCVIFIKDDVAYIQAMDRTSSVFVQTSAELEHEDCSIGINELALFAKYISDVSDQKVSVSVKDISITLKPEKGAKVKYLQADIDLVPSYDPDWDEQGNIIDSEIAEAEYGTPLDMVEEKVEYFTRAMNMFSPNSVFLSIDKRGNVKVHGGKDTGHQFDVTLGKVADSEPCSLKVYGKNLTNILSRVDFGQEPKLYLAEDNAILIKTNTSSWMLQPIEIDNDEE